MSYVAISASFTSDVRNRLRSMRHKEVQSISEVPYRLSGTRTDLLAWAWGKHLHLKEVVPVEWCGSQDKIQIRVNTKEHGQLRIQAELAPELVTPPGGVKSAVMGMSADDPDIKTFIEREQQLHEVGQRWDKVDKQILEFLGKCKSVNEALKLWPQIAVYIPEQYINRVNEKKERSGKEPSQAAEALKNMDTDHLTTAAVISRMSGGQE